MGFFDGVNAKQAGVLVALGVAADEVARLGWKGGKYIKGKFDERKAKKEEEAKKKKKAA